MPLPQTLQLLAPEAEDEPAGHVKQAARLRAPVVSRYEPAGQGCLSDVPPVQKCPTGHGDPAAEVDIGGQYAPAAAVQGVQSAKLDALVVLEYVPTPQACLSDAPPAQK